MESISLILTALIAGATAAAKDTAGKAIKDSYAGLKALIKKKFADNPKAQDTLKDYEEDPETYVKPLQKQLQTLDTNSQKKIKELAEHLLQVLKASESESSTSQPKFSGTFTAEKQMIQQADKIENKDNISF